MKGESDMGKPGRALFLAVVLLSAGWSIPAHLLAGQGVARGERPALDDRFTEVRERIIQQVAEGVVPSISVAVAEKGEVVWEESFGWADLENRIPATPHTMYRLGSITKTITATGLMLLVEEGRVDLDRPAMDYLPKDVQLRVYEGDVRDVTVRHLLNHRGGLPAYAESFYEDVPEKRRPFSETVRRYGIVAYPPGMSFIYSNLGYQLIARIVSEMSGMSYPDFIRERVFSPLGMEESGVYKGTPFRHPYAVNYTPSLERIPLYIDGYPGADGNCSSAHDLIRFAMFHLGDRLPDQEAILTEGAIRSMQAKYPPGNRRYGIGWDLDADEGGYPSVCHGGEGPGVDTFMRLFPTEDIAAVVLCNAECEKLYDIQKAIFSAMIPRLNQPSSAEEQPTERPSDDPSELYGTWRGRIVAYDRELEIEAVVDSEGSTVSVDDQPRDDLDIIVRTSTFLLGMFDARIATPDNERHPYRNRLAVIREGDRLYGAVISVGRWDARAGHYEMPARVELRRLERD